MIVSCQPKGRGCSACRIIVRSLLAVVPPGSAFLGTAGRLTLLLLFLCHPESTSLPALPAFLRRRYGFSLARPHPQRRHPSLRPLGSDCPAAAASGLGQPY